MIEIFHIFMYDKNISETTDGKICERVYECSLYMAHVSMLGIHTCVL